MEWFYWMDLQKLLTDTVDHHILCNTLNCMGIDNTDWFMPYLQERKRLVNVGKV